ncbi:MAG: Tir chaperone family protein [Paucimonas sp.]|nr:Tir chaperone family protein [Paucimonas sp.]
MTDAMQSRNVFFAIVDDVCKELGYPPRANRPELDEVVAMEMDLDGFPFAVVHSLVTASERVLIECRFGPLPGEDKEAVMYRLLQLNYALADAGESIFAVEAETGDVLFTRTCLLANESGRSLLGSMTQMSWQARQWNTHRFLEQKEEMSAGVPLNFGALA